VDLSAALEVAITAAPVKVHERLATRYFTRSALGGIGAPSVPSGCANGREGRTSARQAAAALERARRRERLLV
jgi:hypothetical protein